MPLQQLWEPEPRARKYNWHSTRRKRLPLPLRMLRGRQWDQEQAGSAGMLLTLQMDLLECTLGSHWDPIHDQGCYSINSMMAVCWVLPSLNELSAVCCA